MLHQVDTYVSWINSQLEKRSNSRHVLNLSQDLRDGVVLLQLVEVISKLNYYSGISLAFLIHVCSRQMVRQRLT